MPAHYYGRVEIRRARPADGNAYLQLVHALATYEKLEAPDPTSCQRLLQHAFGDDPRYDLWVATLEERVVAYAVTFETYSTFRALPSLYLEDLFVHPDARRQGIGRSMLTTLRAHAEARGCGRFEWTVLDWNTDAQKLYSEIGATLLEEWRLCRLTL